GKRVANPRLGTAGVSRFEGVDEGGIVDVGRLAPVHLAPLPRRPKREQRARNLFGWESSKGVRAAYAGMRPTAKALQKRANHGCSDPPDSDQARTPRTRGVDGALRGRR